MLFRNTGDRVLALGFSDDPLAILSPHLGVRMLKTKEAIPLYLSFGDNNIKGLVDRHNVSV